MSLVQGLVLIMLYSSHALLRILIINALLISLLVFFRPTLAFRNSYCCCVCLIRGQSHTLTSLETIMKQYNGVRMNMPQFTRCVSVSMLAPFFVPYQLIQDPQETQELEPEPGANSDQLETDVNQGIRAGWWAGRKRW